LRIVLRRTYNLIRYAKQCPPPPPKKIQHIVWSKKKIPWFPELKLDNYIVDYCLGGFGPFGSIKLFLKCNDTHYSKFVEVSPGNTLQHHIFWLFNQMYNLNIFCNSSKNTVLNIKIVKIFKKCFLAKWNVGNFE